MARSFILGLLAGTLFGVLVLACLSLLDKVPGQQAPAVAVETTAVQNQDIDSAALDIAQQVEEPRPSTDVATVDAAEAEPPRALGPETTLPSLQPNPTIETSAFTTQSVTVEPDQTDLAQSSDIPVELPQIDELVLPVPEVAPAPDTTPSTLTDRSNELAGLPETAETIATNRLPTVETPVAVVEPANDTQNTPEPALPRLTNAIPFEHDGTKPTVAFLMIDDPSSGLGISALRSIKHPLTIVIDASRDDAADRIKIYRDAGFEVVAFAPLPSSPSAGDVEQAFSYYLSTLSGLIGFLPTAPTAFGGRDTTQQVAEILLENGYGLVSYSEGLRVAQQVSKKIGLAHATVNRDLDGKGQNSGSIRRFIAQAVFRAANEGPSGNAVFLTRMRSDTFAALQIWTLSNKARDFNIAPLSAILNAT